MRESLPIIIAAAVSFLIAILSGLGVGSGGLFVIWLTAIYGVSAPQARGMNLLFFVFSASSALILHIFKKKVRLKTVAFLSFFTLIGTVIGTKAALYLDAAFLRKFFGIFLILSGSYSLFSRLLEKNKAKKVES